MSVVFSGPALRVSQPIGEFWAASIPANVLLDATVPDPLRLLTSPSGTGWATVGDVGGMQRPIEQRRLKEISAFIRTFEATFPNSVILAVDDESGAEVEGAPWRIEKTGSSGFSKLSIPQGARKARVVDGQHRLYAFGFPEQLDQKFDLLCAIFFGLPDPMQAYVFATINTNQKPVRRGLAMNLYGYNIEDQEKDEWSPEKLSVFVARRLNFEKDSPLHRRIRIEAEGAPEPDPLPGAKRPIPMAAVVDVSLGLVSRNPKRDREALKRRLLIGRNKRKNLETKDAAPLRAWFIGEQDAEIYGLVKEYFRVVEDVLWSGPSALLTRAVDIRALGDFLADIVRLSPIESPPTLVKAVRLAAKRVFEAAKKIEFGDPFFEANYVGRRRVENALRLILGDVDIEQLPPDARGNYLRLVVRPLGLS